MRYLYKGFSTFNRVKKFRVVDEELIKQDLLNHFAIRKGEKLHNPNFGSIIWDMLFEPLTDGVRQAVIDDVKTIVGYDPRISVSKVYVTEYRHGIQIEVELLYVQTDQTDTLKMKFDRNTLTIQT